MTLLVFIMATIGLCIILNKSRLFKPMRKWIHETYEESLARHGINSNFRTFVVWKTFWFLQELILCDLCMGFWTGMLVYLVWHPCASEYLIYYVNVMGITVSVNIIIFGLVSSIASFTYAELLDYVKRR